jgi:hypothetical protein
VVFIRIARSLLGVLDSFQLRFDEAMPLALRINLMCHIDKGSRDATSSVAGELLRLADDFDVLDQKPVDALDLVGTQDVFALSRISRELEEEPGLHAEPNQD